MTHPYYIILNNLYTISTELKVLDEGAQTAQKLEMVADLFLKAVLEGQPTPSLPLTATAIKLSLLRHQELLKQAIHLASKPELPISHEIKTMILATFGNRLSEYGGESAFI